MSKRSKLTTQNKLWLLVAAIVLGGLFLGWNFKIKSDLRTLGELKKATMEETQKQAKLQSIAGLESKLDEARKGLSETSDVSWAVETLNQMAKDSGIEITSMAPLEPEKRDDYEKMSLRVESECRYHSLGNFISKIENNPKLMKVTSVMIKKAGPTGEDKQNTSGLLQVTLTVSMFHAL